MSHPDLDQLLNTLLPFAQEALKKRGAFLPFGASMSADGSISLAAGYATDQGKNPAEIVALLVDGLRSHASAGEIKASGICFDVKVVPPGQRDKVDAIETSLEHVSGEAIEVFLPYRKTLFRTLKYGELFASPGIHRVFLGNTLQPQANQ